MSRTSTLPKRLRPMLATLTDAPFDDPNWVFEDKFDGFRMVAEIRRGKVALYSRNGKIISHSYIEVAKALESVKGDAVIHGELVALGKNGVSHFQLLQNALRHEAKLLYCAFDLMFENGDDLRKLPLIERKERLKAILPRVKLIAFSSHRKANGKRFFAEAQRKGLEGIMAKRADSAYASGGRTSDWLKIKTAKRQDHTTDGDLVHLADGLADQRRTRRDRLCRLAAGSRPDQVARVDVGLVDELVDVDGPRGFQCDLLELLLRNLDEGVLIEHVALDDVLVRHLALATRAGARST